MIQARTPVVAVVAGMIAAAGCSSEQGISGQKNTEVFAQSPNDQVDILFVVDDSYSMAEEQAALAAGFTDFITEIEASAIDFHLGVVSTSQEADDPERGRMIGTPRFLTSDDDYVTEFRNRVQLGVNGSDKEKGLEAMSLALSPALLEGPHFGFLRDDAHLLIVFVSDEEDCSDSGKLDGMEADACYLEDQLLVSVDSYAAQLLQAKRGAEELINIGAVIGLSGPFACADAWPGIRYAQLVQEFGGAVGSICEGDWGDMLYDIGLVAAGILTDFPLEEAADPETIEVFVDDEPIDEDPLEGWRYNPAEWEIEFHGRYVPPRGSEITITYEIVPNAGPPPG